MKIGIGLLVVCCVVVLFFGIRSQTGTNAREPYQISGTVFDDQGNPLEGARVSAIARDRPIRGRLPNAHTDENGRFTISDLQPGKYSVIVEKEKDGYADFTSIAFDYVPTLADLSEEKPKTEVSIQMSKKASRVTGVITDKTKAKVKDAQIKICLVEQPEICSPGFVDDDGRFEIVTPAEKEFTLTVSKEGYRDYKLKQKINGVAKESVILKHGEKHHVLISLD